MSARISVAIATRDRPQTLARCLESLRTGRVLPSEVVVADQSARPDTRAVVEAADRPYLPVHWVAGGADGLAGGQNAAFARAGQPVVAVLDDDCVADPGWIETLEHAFAAHSDMALVGGGSCRWAHPATAPLPSRRARARRDRSSAGRRRPGTWAAATTSRFAASGSSASEAATSA